MQQKPSKKENIDAVDDAGQTALIMACKVSGCEENVRLLLKQGADVNIIDYEQQTALTLASKNSEKMHKLIMKLNDKNCCGCALYLV